MAVRPPLTHCHRASKQNPLLALVRPFGDLKIYILGCSTTTDDITWLGRDCIPIYILEMKHMEPTKIYQKMVVKVRFLFKGGWLPGSMFTNLFIAAAEPFITSQPSPRGQQLGFNWHETNSACEVHMRWFHHWSQSISSIWYINPNSNKTFTKPRLDISKQQREMTSQTIRSCL